MVVRGKREEETQLATRNTVSVSNRGQVNAMDAKISLPISLLLILGCAFVAGASAHKHDSLINPNGSSLAGIELPDHMSFNAVSSSGATGCGLSSLKQPGQTDSAVPSYSDIDDDDDDDDDEVEGDASFLLAKSQRETVKLHLKRRSASSDAGSKESVAEFTGWDLSRIHTLYRRMTERKNQNTISRLKKGREKKPNWGSDYNRVDPPAPAPMPEFYGDGLSGQLMATLGSGVALGSGEYFMDVFVGTPPKHFLLILDTGSDLNWIQCVPCYDCFEQNGPHYDPKDSSSFKHIGCHDPRCELVSSPDPPQPCKDENQTCPYFYWYGDSSNTTGDFALETFTVNLTARNGKSEYRRVENVMFGCGHWNRGLFHGAAGLLGLGRGPLSFSSQLQSLYGHSFSYCLVDRNSDTSVSSKLIFGEDRELLSHPNLNFTSFVAGKENPADTFYYVQIKSIIVGGEVLNISKETWELSQDGSGGTIIDSGTTLSYFAEPANTTIKEAFIRKVNKKYPLVKDIEILYPCYNVSGVEKVDLPEFAIEFADGAVWNFPVENYFIPLSDDIVCLALMGTPKSALSIIGNYQQQNFHILYDTKKSRLGYAPMRCAEI
ncbi:hypothetical protein CRG98_048276 [Punica granatum]|uniref:Peptidase A1 domain-containing protein n=1 Tax=Punica granatum TaxID=22663 RepID=A0A2I0HIL9_PUNGR|nr:hypothetical protein CRG98_048276 [Punica granatum]